MESEKPIVTLTVASDSTAHTEALGRLLGKTIVADLTIALTGELGAGKTTLTRGIAAGLTIAAQVTSPTFTLVNEYESSTSSNRLIHVDTYRLGQVAADAVGEAGTIGIDDLLDEVDTGSGSGATVLVIEWAERIAALLPPDHLEIRLDYADRPVMPEQASIADRRWITFTGHGPSSAAVVEALSEGNLFPKLTV